MGFAAIFVIFTRKFNFRT